MFCLRELALREGAAGRRIGAMRVLREFPRLEAPLRDGRLSLTTAVTLRPVLTQENQDEIVALAASVLREAVRCAIEKHGKRRGAVKPARTRKPVAPKPRPPGEREPIPAEVRRAVWERDGGRCNYQSPEGRRCECRWRLELDHIQPAALGGPSTVENLRLRCRVHNSLHAEETFGRAYMARFTRAGRPESRTGEALSPAIAHYE